jgi:hypothetical protein
VDKVNRRREENRAREEQSKATELLAMLISRNSRLTGPLGPAIAITDEDIMPGHKP